MKYTIAAIATIAAGLLIWVLIAGSGTDAVIMVVAIISVTFFASLPNLWNSMYRKHAAPKPVDRSNATVVRWTAADGKKPQDPPPSA
ncbi:MAG: hypothetical protein JSR77_13985 [Planctomycetes bacterium]|nr:hypothetical protein [Planctomycetota bacterium]